MKDKIEMALSPPHKRVLRIPGFRTGSAASGRADPGGRCNGSARGNGYLKDGKCEEAGLRICSINVGTITGKSGELAKMLEERRVSVACVQEIRWKGCMAKYLGNGY